MSKDGPKIHALTIVQTPEQLRLQTWLQLVRVFSLMERMIAAELTEQGLTLPQFDVLATLRFAEGSTQKELAERLLVTKGNVCGLLDRLENLGWVQRRTDAQDNRINRLHLTAAGRRKLDNVLPRHDRSVLQSMKHLSDADVKQMRSSLEQLEAGIHDAT